MRRSFSKRLVLRYKEAGYAAITVTDHYKAFAFSCAGTNWDAPGDMLITYRRILQNSWTLYAVVDLPSWVRKV